MANNASLWRLRSSDLLTAADVLRKKAIDAMSRPNFASLDPAGVAEGECLKYAGLVIQAAMLQAFGIECLMKCLWVHKGNRVAIDGRYKIPEINRENHDLVVIATSTGFVVTETEASVLKRISGFGRSFGRYPIAKNWQDQGFSVNETGCVSGASWSDDDHETVTAIIVRLMGEIDRVPCVSRPTS